MKLNWITTSILFLVFLVLLYYAELRIVFYNDIFAGFSYIFPTYLITNTILLMLVCFAIYRSRHTKNHHLKISLRIILSILLLATMANLYFMLMY